MGETRRVDAGLKLAVAELGGGDSGQPLADGIRGDNDQPQAPGQGFT